ncbi:hypothetical protein [Pseudomonas sp. MYb118]|uniref:hypothetical protein n=1 Tax=Pseudomonas sp. MYb118 TaxID=1848720 RepID=UPI0034CD2237
MEVVIGDVTSIGNEIVVGFSTSFGSGIGFWKGVAPAVNESHDVELEIGEAIVWGENGHFSLNNVCLIEMGSDSVKLTGRIVHIDDDGFAVLDVNGSVVLLEIIDFTGGIPVFVDLCIKKIDLYPTGV